MLYCLALRPGAGADLVIRYVVCISKLKGSRRDGDRTQTNSILNALLSRSKAGGRGGFCDQVCGMHIRMWEDHLIPLY